ncbi:MAG: lipoyl(octanoyl) transferase LipB [Gemmatimonadota bacterium]|nr:MAG: lipoyl(octanoyl) transferase LipB [Gemmatimonadota bacterium]
MSAQLDVLGLGRKAYGDALELQRRLARDRIAGRIEHDVLILVEHSPVVTLGRSFRPQSLPTPRAALEARGIEVFDIERGGDITFHGPGQLVGYPIFDLKQHRQDVHWFLRQLEESLIRSLASLGIQGERREGHTGVWTASRKIASIGIHLKQWVTWHGFALNVTTDLSYFDLIVPCGIPNVIMTSIHRELAEHTPRDVWARALEQVVLGVAEVFEVTPQMVSLEAVLARIGADGVVEV